MYLIQENVLESFKRMKNQVRGFLGEQTARTAPARVTAACGECSSRTLASASRLPFPTFWRAACQFIIRRNTSRSDPRKYEVKNGF